MMPLASSKWIQRKIHSLQTSGCS